MANGRNEWSFMMPHITKQEQKEYMEGCASARSNVIAFLSGSF